MRLDDLLYMSISSLWKRKVRTILTVLGVVIGTASIVVMVSLGLGLNRAAMKDIEANGGLTTITVQEANRYMENGKEDQKGIEHLDDALVETIRENPYVELASPVLTVSVMAKCGVYVNYLQLRGMSTEALQSMQFSLESGQVPLSEETLTFLYGNQVLAGFQNPKTGTGYWTDGVLPDISLEKDAVFFVFDMNGSEAVNSSSQGAQSVSAAKPPKKYLAQYAGMIAGGVDTYNSDSWNVYCNIVPLEAQLKRIYRGKAIPGQPVTATGRPYRQMYYNEIYVKVDSMEHMSQVQKWITDMGYQTYSNTEWVDSMKKQYGYIQAVLGGIGAVSLLVAAIGITNTMMMSIYERTKEIGVMKVIGCDMRNIRSLFLLEAGFIGLIGGTVGILFSLMISVIINRVTSGMGMEMALSYIPFWLAGGGIGFAVLVGMLAGFFPALRAMRLSPLAAIRNE